MSDSPWYVVTEGTNIRWCFDSEHKCPRVFDTEEIAKDEIDRIKRIVRASIKRVPISIDEYDRKHSKFVGEKGENRPQTDRGEQNETITNDTDTGRS